MIKKVRFYCEHKALKLIGWFLCRLSRRTVLRLGAVTGSFVYTCVPVRKEITLSQLRTAFPEKTEDEIRLIAKQAYQNLVCNCFEHLCIPALEKEDLLSIVHFRNEEAVQRAYARGRGIIFAGGHFGNWEYMGAAVSAKGYPLSFVVAHIANFYIDETVNEHRRKMGTKILSKGMSIRDVITTLKGNGGMAMLLDQDAGKGGVFVDFFNRPCSAPQGPARIAIKTGAAVLYISAIREEDGTITAAFEEIPVEYEQGATDANIKDLTQRCTTRLEQSIREVPGQWLWMHRRWKTTPEKAAELKAKP